MPVSIQSPISSRFILAGDARFTLSTPSGSHHTYRVRHVEGSPERYPWSPTYFVHFLSGSDNDSDESYTYLGILDSYTLQARVTTASKHLDGAYKLTLLNRVLARVATGDHDAYLQHGFRTRHEGRCGRCGRVLTTPASIDTGIGPECSRILGIDYGVSTVRGETPPTLTPSDTVEEIQTAIDTTPDVLPTPKSDTMRIYEKRLQRFPLTSKQFLFADRVYTLAESLYERGGDVIVDGMYPEIVCKQFSSLKRVKEYMAERESVLADMEVSHVG